MKWLPIAGPEGRAGVAGGSAVACLPDESASTPTVGGVVAGAAEHAARRRHNPGRSDMAGH